MSKINKICADCKSEDVVKNAWVKWDFLKQEWVIHSIFDGEDYCRSCEEMSPIEEISQ